MIKVKVKQVFDCDKETLWNIVTDPVNYLWRSDISKIDSVDENHFIEYTKRGYPTFFTIVQKRKFQVYEFQLENTNMVGHWIGSFAGEDGGATEFEFIESLDIKSRIMKIIGTIYLKKQQKRYVRDLKKIISQK